MKKIKVRICVGTTCFIMGASELQNLDNLLPEDLANKVEISGASCLGVCKHDNYGEAPFVMVDEEVISHANINIIIDKIYEKLSLRRT